METLLSLDLLLEYGDSVDSKPLPASFAVGPPSAPSPPDDFFPPKKAESSVTYQILRPYLLKP
jgi:hypothetical protein